MSFWKKLKNKLKLIGPGFITGAADDDPSGVATYSIAGAQFGYKLNWLTLFLFPAMVVVQEMCGRIGMLTGRGLSGVIKKFYSKKLAWFAVLLLIFANVVNIGADLGIMAASLDMLFGWHYGVSLAGVAIGVALLEILVSYKTYVKYLKWLGLSLLVYVVTAFLVKQDWLLVFKNMVLPQIEWSEGYIMTLVGFLGTTISPYLFFWQASEEVEEEIEEKKIEDFREQPLVRTGDVKRMDFDTRVGMLFSNLMTFFIIITTAATLHANGIFSIETPQQAALALKPLAGDFAYFLFAIGIIGIGLQSIPVLAGSVAYGVAELLDMNEGLSKKFMQAKGFYLILALATMTGAVINFLGINTMQALYYAAIVNGVVAVPLIAIIIKLSSDERVVGRFKTGKVARVIGWVTFGFMLLSVVLMFWTMFK